MLKSMSSKLGTMVLRTMLLNKVHQPVIQCQCTSPEVFIMLVPGAMLYPNDYVSLRDALMDHSKGSSVCLITCAPDWAAIDVADFISSAATLVNNSIEQAMHAVRSSEYGSRLEKDEFGRYTRLVVIMHSLSGLVSTGYFALKKASAVIMLASSLSQAVSGICPALRSFPLPVLSIFGEFDGQQHLGKVAIDLCNSGVFFGGSRSACYFAMIPKCNHASCSNGKRNALRGDISIEGIQDASINTVTSQVADLTLSHFIPSVMSSKDDAELNRQTQSSMSLLQGYLQELGRIPRKYTPEDSSYSEFMQVLRYCGGNEMSHADATQATLLFHPGQLARADEFAVHVQKYILEATCQNEKRTIVVTANVHTDTENFRHSPVTQRETPSTLSIEVQCLASVPIKGTEYAIVAPCYALKLFSPRQHLETRGFDGTPSLVQDIFNIAWNRAEESAAHVLLKRFQERGHPLVVTTNFHCLPQRWMSSQSTLKNGKLTLQTFGTSFGDTQGRVADPFNQPGLLCCHVPSVAWCMEYIYVHGLKDHH